MAFTLHPIGLQQDSFLNSLLINVSQDMDELCEQESKHSYKGKYWDDKVNEEERH